MRQPVSTYRPRLSGVPCSSTRVGAVAGFTQSATGFGFQAGPAALLSGSDGSPTCCASSVSRSTCSVQTACRGCSVSHGGICGSPIRWLRQTVSGLTGRDSAWEFTLMWMSVGLLISTSTDAVSPHSHSTGPVVELGSAFFSVAKDVNMNGPSCS